MNEDQITTLLDRLASQVDVAPPLVERVADTGRRRLRWRHGIQVASTAAVVAALAGGGVVLQQERAADGLATNQAPTVNALVGTWTPTMLAGNPTPPEGLSARPITFSREQGATGQLSWSGNDGCPRVVGPVRLGANGAFHASVGSTISTQCLGVRGSLPFSSVSAVTGASHVRIAAGRLMLTSPSDTTLGIFVRSRPTEPSPGPSLVPGRAPTEADLLGTWRPALLGAGPWPAIPDLYPGQWLTFDNTGGIRWHGEDGCNSVAGRARLGADGSFTTSDVSTTLVGCIGPGGKPPYTELDVMLHATRVRLVDHGLAFYRGGTRLGLFLPGKTAFPRSGAGR